MNELEADFDARKFRTVNGVRGGSGSYPDYDESVCGGLGCGCSEW
jgi:hypothetical protein